MAELSDAFLALPGGFGTFDELFECVTWAQLGIHRKPVALLNVAGYFDDLVRFLDHAVEEGFISPANRKLIAVSDEVEEALDLLAAYEAPHGPAWTTTPES